MSEWVKGRCLRSDAGPILKFEASSSQSSLTLAGNQGATVTLQQNSSRGEFDAKVFKDTSAIYFGS